MGRALDGAPVGNQMDKLKKSSVLILITALFFLAGAFGLSGIHAWAGENRVLFDTPVYATSDLSGTPVGTLRAGESVEIKESAENWLEIAYGEGVAYVKKDAIYFRPNGELFVYENVKVTATAKKKLIFLYSAPDRAQSTGMKLSDGKKLIKCGEEGDFYFVTTPDGEESGYVLKEHITTGMTYNQRIATIISTVFALAAILTGILFYLKRRIPQRKK